MAGTLLLPPAPAQAATRDAYFTSLEQTSNPDWMNWVPDDASLGSLSIPGTHDTLSIMGGAMVETQEDFGANGVTLLAQLEAGIRAIDIRVHRIDNSFTVHHGAIYQNANFADVIWYLNVFLSMHPTETVLMNLHSECTGQLGSCTDIPASTTQADREAVFDWYRDNAPGASRFWAPSVSGLSAADMPNLGEVRGKIVLTQFTGPFGGIYQGYGLTQLTSGAWDHYFQNNYEATSFVTKRDLIRAHWTRTNADAADVMYINYSSAADFFGSPSEVAGGTDDTGGDGVNYWVMRDLLEGYAGRTGVMMMDFPGPALVDVIIAYNYRIAPWSSQVAESAADTFEDIAWATRGNAEERNNQIRGFFTHVTPSVLWHTVAVNQPYGFYVNYDNVFGDAGERGGYRMLAWPSELGNSSTSLETVQPVVDAALGGLSGDNEARAHALADAVSAAFPNQWWSVILHQGNGGFGNWISTTYGVSYQKSFGDHTYIVQGVDKTEEMLPDPGVPTERIAYFPSWSVYANNFYPKTLDTNGAAAKLTTLMYAFENIDPVNLTCMAANKSGTTDDNDPDGNDGASDAWADYQMSFTADKSVDGVADQWAQPLKGNFNQLKKLKAKHPHLRVLVSIGGWTYSKFFSDAAATPVSRERFVRSCIDLYIRGNLPQLGDDPAGGTGVAAGVFDGIDIDWEFPASDGGRPGNHYGPQDTANFTALLGEFRRQLDALGGPHYLLTAAVPAGPEEITDIQVGQIAQYLDFANVMTYDMHGAWETAGPTNFNAPLYDAPGSPAAGSGLTVDDAIDAYLANGFPPNKLTLGVPFYARGWTGVPAGGTNGLYQAVTGPTTPFPYSQTPGVAMYKELVAAGKMNDPHYDPATKSSWVYDGTNFFSTETPQSLTMKRRYVKNNGLAGMMMYSLESDDAGTTLLKAATGIS